MHEYRDLEDLRHVLMVNVVGTYAVTKAFLPLLHKGTQKTIVNISSDAGCHAQNASFIHSDQPSEGGVGLSYRTSKAALNMGEASPCSLPYLSLIHSSSLVQSAHLQVVSKFATDVQVDQAKMTMPLTPIPMSHTQWVWQSDIVVQLRSVHVQKQCTLLLT